MKYKIENNKINFEVDESTFIPLLTSIIEVLVPHKYKKIYFTYTRNEKYPELNHLVKKGVIILGKGSNDAPSNSASIFYYWGFLEGNPKHYLSLWAPANEKISKKEWNIICNNILSRYKKI